MTYFIVIYVICAIYMTLNFKYDLQMFQQNSYRFSRYCARGSEARGGW